MTKPHILNQYERAALLALSQDTSIPAHGEARRGFGKAHLDVLVRLGLAIFVPQDTDRNRNNVRITDDGWRCMYGLTKAEFDSHTNVKPVPYRIWQWPTPTALKRAA